MDILCPVFFYSNGKEIVGRQQRIFEVLWGNAIPGDQKIKQIEKGIEPDFIDIIRDSRELRDKYINEIKSSKSDLFLLFPTIRAYTAHKNMGLLEIINF